MGDIFDFLAPQISYFKKVNKDAIELIQELSLKYEVYYFEGNHDFNLKALFPSCKVVSLNEQPKMLKVDNKTIELAHGDIFVGKAYEIYSAVFRSKITLGILNLIDISNWLSKKSEKKLAKKHICHEIKNFKEIVENRMEYYKADIVIEGHFHEGKTYEFGERRYINIPSLACGKKYIIYKDSEFKTIQYK
jgi:UDP-2,3-diacylglucosamine hydrolase